MSALSDHDPVFIKPSIGPTPSEAQCEDAVSVPVASIRMGDSPRLDGSSKAHVKLLAEVDEQWPPIVVHRPTMKVIDGTHRLMAAVARDQDTIAVHFFDGTEDEAFTLAVWANVSHGRPLTLADRKAAAARVHRAWPEWSDRRVARLTGLSHGTVASVRKCASGQTDHLNARIGIDGRRHPPTTSSGRQTAAEIIRADRGASLREIAKRAGISPGTVRDVRSRLQRGEEPLPVQHQTAQSATAGGVRHEPDSDRNGALATIGVTAAQRATGDSLAHALDRLRADPAIRFNDNGRALIRVLAMAIGTMREFEQLPPVTPQHCRSTVAAVAMVLAESWLAVSGNLATATP